MSSREVGTPTKTWSSVLLIAAGAFLGIFALARGAADYRAYTSPFDQVYSPDGVTAGFFPLLSPGVDYPLGDTPGLDPILLAPPRGAPGLFGSRLLAAGPPDELNLELLPARQQSNTQDTQIPRASANASPETALVTEQEPVWIPEGVYIPALNLNAPILRVGAREIEYKNRTFQQWMAPDQFAAGWHNTSATFGKPGNTVLNGHHNAFDEVFRDLRSLENGDWIYLTSGGRVFTYQVGLTLLLNERFETVETRLANAQWIRPSNDERLTLITCWPYESNTHRVIVVAVPVDTPAGGDDDLAR